MPDWVQTFFSLAMKRRLASFGRFYWVVASRWLAREQGISYATLAVVANHAAGRGESRKSVDIEHVGVVLDEAMHRVRTILEYVVETNGD